MDKRSALLQVCMLHQALVDKFNHKFSVFSDLKSLDFAKCRRNVGWTCQSSFHG